MLDLQNKKGSAGTNALTYHRVSTDEKKSFDVWNLLFRCKSVGLVQSRRRRVGGGIGAILQPTL